MGVMDLESEFFLLTLASDKVRNIEKGSLRSPTMRERILPSFCQLSHPIMYSSAFDIIGQIYLLSLKTVIQWLVTKNQKNTHKLHRIINDNSM